MGGPRITKEQIDKAKELRHNGIGYSDIANVMHLSITSIIKYTRDTPARIVLNDGEEIADIGGYDGMYKVTSFGRVFSLVRGKDNPKELRQQTSKYGIKSVAIAKSHGQRIVHVDKLVADAFVDGYSQDTPYIRHIDKDFSNNNANNLMWSDENPMVDLRKEINRQNAMQKESPINDEDVEVIRDKWLTGVRQTEIAKEYGVSPCFIHKLVDGLRRDIKLPKCEPGEEWAKVDGYEGRYFISSHGRLFSTGLGRRDSHIMKSSTDSSGYKYVQLSGADGSTMTTIHRLVASAFCPGRTEEKNTVNHIDGNPSNNHADNLEWCTNYENIKHAMEVLGHKYGGNDQTLRRTKRVIPKDASSKPSPFRRFTPDDVIAIRNDPRSARQIAKQYGVNKSTITRILRGESYKYI